MSLLDLLHQLVNSYQENTPGLLSTMSLCDAGQHYSSEGFSSGGVGDQGFLSGGASGGGLGVQGEGLISSGNFSGQYVSSGGADANYTSSGNLFLQAPTSCFFESQGEKQSAFSVPLKKRGNA